jgi:hypothetical protein
LDRVGFWLGETGRDEHDEVKLLENASSLPWNPFCAAS